MVISNAMRPRCFSRFHLPVSFRGLVGQLSCAAQATSQPSQIKIRKLLYHRFLSGGFLLAMYNRRDRRVIPSRNSGGTLILQHRLSTCKKSAFSLPAVKDTCLFLTYAGEILLLPLPTVLDTYFRFLTTPGVRRGEKTFSTPYRNCCPLSSAGSLVTITGGPYSIGQGNRQSRRRRPRTPQDFI